VDEATPFNAHAAQTTHDSLMRNPEEAATRGLWTDEAFLRNVSTLPTRETKFADYHGHGWVFRAVFWQDRKGNLLDNNGKVIDWNASDKLARAVQLMDIHAEKGMHCVDCHAAGWDAHSNGRLYGEYPDAVEVQCVDCHGTISHRASLTTSGPAAPEGGNNLANLITPSGKLRFEWVSDIAAGRPKLLQRSMLDPDKEWEVKQVVDTIDPLSPTYNGKARLVKTIQKDGNTWGGLPAQAELLAHRDTEMACFTCHTSWVTSCFGCHLPQQANWKKSMQHFEGDESRNWTSYNPQVLRHDIFMLAKHSTTK
jgi:hypothetical protein